MPPTRKHPSSIPIISKAKPEVGYSGKSLKVKLGIKAGMHACIIHPPEAYFFWIDHSLRSGNPDSPPWDFVHLFTNTLEELEQHLFEFRKSIRPDGMIWVSWYKKSSGNDTEITEDLVRETCLPLGLVDVKVCAVSKDWSGLKLVIRKELR